MVYGFKFKTRKRSMQGIGPVVMLLALQEVHIRGRVFDVCVGCVCECLSEPKKKKKDKKKRQEEEKDLCYKPKLQLTQNCNIKKRRFGKQLALTY